jgi:hypothetical protein
MKAAEWDHLNVAKRLGTKRLILDTQERVPVGEDLRPVPVYVLVHRAFVAYRAALNLPAEIAQEKPRRRGVDNGKPAGA